MAARKREPIKTLEAAAGVYEMLARLFLREPTPAQIEQLCTGDPGKHMARLGYHVTEGLEHLDAAAREEALAVEYCRLFIGPGPHLSPHEAVIRGESRHWGQATVDVCAVYAEAGFELRTDVREMPDHVGVEFQFVATLLHAELASRRQRRSAQEKRAREQRRQFLEAHLSRWLPGFAEAVAERSHLAFYRGLSRFAADWVEAELQQLS